MKRIYLLLTFCLLILSVFISCDDKSQGVELVTITLDSGVLKEEAKTIETAENTSVILPSGDSLWSTSGYTFSGWAETATGIDKYKAGDKYSSSKSITLYATWIPNPKITYNPNGGKGDAIIEYCKSGEKVTIKNTDFKMEGYTLSYWSTSADATDKYTYTIGQEITLTQDLTLYAVWIENENKATITYSSNGGSGTISSVSFAKGTEVTLDKGSALSRDGFILASWNTSSDGNGTAYQLGSELTLDEDITLYAVWTEKYNIKYYSYNEGDDEYKLIAIDYPQRTSTIIGDGNGLAKAGFVLYWTTTKVLDGTGNSYDVGNVYTGKSVSLYAQWREDTRLKYTLNDGGTAYSVRASSKDISGEIEIPDTYKGVKVTSIEDLGFEKCTGITKVTIPESVTSIGGGAFHGCKSLTSVNIPEGVTKLKAYDTEDYRAGLFEECSALKTIKIPSKVTEIGYCSFMNCISLETINIPGNVTLIDGHAFYGCTRLASVSLQETVTEIGSYAFYGSGLTSIEIPSSVTKIGSNAFENCPSLKAIYINKIYDSSFDGYATKWGAPSRCTVTLEPTQVGDIMELGTYLTESGSYEAITWKCIQYDSDNKRALMISDNVITTSTFGSDSTYAGSTIQKYLTGKADTDFIGTYKIDTSKMIGVTYESIETTVLGSVDDTNDKLFLLSCTEAFESGLFANDAARKATNLSGTNSSWWLRTTDNAELGMCFVDVDGSGKIDVVSDKYGVRPAFWYTWE